MAGNEKQAWTLISKEQNMANFRPPGGGSKAVPAVTWGSHEGATGAELPLDVGV